MLQFAFLWNYYTRARRRAHAAIQPGNMPFLLHEVSMKSTRNQFDKTDNNNNVRRAQHTHAKNCQMMRYNSPLDTHIVPLIIW